MSGSRASRYAWARARSRRWAGPASPGVVRSVGITRGAEEVDEIAHERQGGRLVEAVALADQRTKDRGRRCAPGPSVILNGTAVTRSAAREREVSIPRGISRITERNRSSNRKTYGSALSTKARQPGSSLAVLSLLHRPGPFREQGEEEVLRRCLSDQSRCSAGLVRARAHGAQGQRARRRATADASNRLGWSSRRARSPAWRRKRSA